MWDGVRGVRFGRCEGIDSQFSSWSLVWSAPAQGPELGDPLFVGDNIIWWLTVLYHATTTQYTGWRLCWPNLEILNTLNTTVHSTLRWLSRTLTSFEQSSNFNGLAFDSIWDILTCTYKVMHPAPTHPPSTHHIFRYSYIYHILPMIW